MSYAFWALVATGITLWFIWGLLRVVRFIQLLRSDWFKDGDEDVHVRWEYEQGPDPDLRKYPVVTPYALMAVKEHGKPASVVFFREHCGVEAHRVFGPYIYMNSFTVPAEGIAQQRKPEARVIDDGDMVPW